MHKDPTAFSDAAARLLSLYLRMPVAARKQRFLSTYDAAQRYRMGQRTLQRLIAEGKVEAFVLGQRRWMIDLVSLNAYLIECNTP